MLFADRTSTSWMRSNQIRLYFSTVAYLLMQGLRRLGLVGTELAKAQCNTVRLQVAQDRSPDSHHRTQGLGVAIDGLSISRAIPPGASAVASFNLRC